MDVNKVQARAILVFGAPGSGKTTFAEKFATKFHAAYYDLEEVAEKYKFNRRTILKAIELVAKTKATIIIEGGLDTEKDRNEIKNVLRKAGYTPSLVWIQTDVGTIKMRLKMRHHDGGKARDEYETRIENMEAPTEVETPIVLSGKHTFETQLRHVLTQIA